MIIEFVQYFEICEFITNTNLLYKNCVRNLLLYVFEASVTIVFIDFTSSKWPDLMTGWDKTYELNQSPNLPVLMSKQSQTIITYAVCIVSSFVCKIKSSIPVSRQNRPFSHKDVGN